MVGIRYKAAPDENIWQHQAWYMTPDDPDSAAWQRLLGDSEFSDEIINSRKLCSQAIPFIGEFLQGDDYFAAGSFLGQAETGMFCNTPLTVNQFFSSPMDGDPDYACPKSEFPHKYPTWNPKWYSPLCRGWYKEQKSKSSQNTLSDLYTFANGQVFGLTPCAPIVDFSKKTDGEFVAALCLDIDPSGSLDSYYVFEKEDKATYMLYNDREDEDIGDIDVNSDTQFM